MNDLPCVQASTYNDVMRDVVYLAITFGFFGVCMVFIRLCDRVIGPDGPDTPEHGEVARP